MVIERLLGFGTRDLLVPYFVFSTKTKAPTPSPTLTEILRLRFDVYCLECDFLSPDEFQDGLEIDEFDQDATHFSAHTLDNQIVGAVRLVQPEASAPFPFETHCSIFENYMIQPRDRSAEISRLVVRKTHRRRLGDTMQGVAKSFVDEGNAASIKPRLPVNQREGHSPLLLLGLYREMYRYSRAHGIRFWYAAMEKPLVKSLDKMGFHFTAIGPQTDYYGPVAPFVLDLEETFVQLYRENKFLAAWFHDEPVPFYAVIHAVWRAFRRRLIGQRSTLVR